MTLHDPSQCGDPGSLPNMPNLAGVRKVQVESGDEWNLSPNSWVLGLFQCALFLENSTLAILQHVLSPTP